MKITSLRIVICLICLLCYISLSSCISWNKKPNCCVSIVKFNRSDFTINEDLQAKHVSEYLNPRCSEYFFFEAKKIQEFIRLQLGIEERVVFLEPFSAKKNQTIIIKRGVNVTPIANIETKNDVPMFCGHCYIMFKDKNSYAVFYGPPKKNQLFVLRMNDKPIPLNYIIGSWYKNHDS